ncbi:hypothetical protein MTR_8g083270 [Medicago truncatula]|uniref:Uncharacterized protein n=1 Tax=Medicago truncatula TaxID=3880 RepID=G7LH43_MEDTR|nr:hypothetical protein MTR_8g083270 [Medicago truncatula]
MIFREGVLRRWHNVGDEDWLCWDQAIVFGGEEFENWRVDLTSEDSRIGERI